MNVIDLWQAEQVAADYLANLGREIGMPLQLVKRRDLPYGWLFFYNSQAYLQNGEVGAMLAGNAPFVVDAIDGSLHILGTASPVDVYLREYETKRGYSKE
ncbi:unnamed protein product [marine sediment metagenome]|uniref:Immunity protein 35 domain-containing protein n=1 Tax=marine sediment metagenome TaxID=412755 RepID=X1MC39_9ZZZZ